MALWDPEAAGNAAIYLRLPDIDLIDIRNAPFEGKTAVWVPYSDTGYTKGKKIGDKGDKIEVERLVDNKVKEYKTQQSRWSFGLKQDSSNHSKIKLRRRNSFSYW